MNAFTVSNKIEIKEENDITRIVGELKRPKANYFILIGVFLFILVYAFIRLSANNLNNPSVWAIFLTLLGIPTVIGFWIGNKINSSFISNLEIIINKTHRTIELPKEHLNFAFSDLNDVLIGEKTLLFQKVNIIKFILKDGEKTLEAPIYNYNDGSKIVATIKSSVGI